MIERDLEDMIFDTLAEEGSSVLRERGLFLSGLPYRQVHIPNVGRIDLLTINFDYNRPRSEAKRGRLVTLTAVELKNVPVGYNEIGQLCRYVRALEDVANRMPEKTPYSIVAKGIMIAPSYVTTGDASLVLSELQKNEDSEGCPIYDFYTFRHSLRLGCEFEQTGAFSSPEFKHDELRKIIDVSARGQHRELVSQDLWNKYTPEHPIIEVSQTVN